MNIKSILEAKELEDIPLIYIIRIISFIQKEKLKCTTTQ